MKKVHGVLWFTLLLPLVWAAPSYGTVFKIATLSPDGSSWMVKMREGGKQVAKSTAGRVKFKFYPGGVMGSDKAVLRKIRLGQLQGAAVPGGSLSKFSPIGQLYTLPLLFRSFDEVDYVRKKMDSLIVEELEKGGFVTFGLGEGGLAYLMTNSEVTHVDQLLNKKVWVPDADRITVKTVRSMGISPIPLAIGDVLASLQTGLIDTVATSPIAAIALQWHTQISHMTDLPLLYFYALLAIDKKSFDHISATDQAIVRKIMSQAFTNIDAQNRKDNLAAFKAMQTQGIKLARPNNQQLVEWRKRSQIAIDKLLHEGVVQKAPYQKMMGYLKRYRTSQAGL